MIEISAKIYSFDSIIFSVNLRVKYISSLIDWVL